MPGDDVDAGMYNDECHLLAGDRGSDTDSVSSTPTKSFRDSRLSIASRGSHTVKSPTL